MFHSIVRNSRAISQKLIEPNSLVWYQVKEQYKSQGKEMIKESPANTIIPA
jgi:hypothetical protein